MAVLSQGPFDAAAGANDASVGTVAWNNPATLGNLIGTLPTIANGPSTTIVGNYLKSFGHGFSLPSSAIVKGIVAVLTIGSSTGGVGTRDTTVKLVKAGTVQGANKGTGSDFPSPNGDVTYGSATDLWGSSWTASDINNANFGVALSPTIVASAEAEAYHFKITVYYKDLTLTPSQLPPAQSLVAYSKTIAIANALGGTAPYSITKTAGTMPGGVTFTAGSPASIAGTPTFAAGAGGPISYPLTIKITDSDGDTLSQSY